MSSNSGSGSAKWISIVVMVVGAIMVIAGAVTYAQVSSTLRDERITVSDDATASRASRCRGPFAAYCEADIIETTPSRRPAARPTPSSTVRIRCAQVAMNGSFLRASLFTSVVAFGVAAMAIGIGIVFILIGVALLNIAGRMGGAKAA